MLTVGLSLVSMLLGTTHIKLSCLGLDITLVQAPNSLGGEKLEQLSSPVRAQALVNAVWLD